MLPKLNKNALFTITIKFTLIVLSLLAVNACEEHKIFETKQEKLSPELSVEISNNMIFLNKTVTFTITVKNTDPQEVKNLVVACTLADELEYISSTVGSMVRIKSKKAKITWNIDLLPADSSMEMKLTARGIIENFKVMNTFELIVEKETMKKEVPLRISGIFRHFISTYDTEDPVEVGSTTIYIITVPNEGMSDATGVILFNDIPEEMEFVKAEGPTDYTYNLEKRRVEFKPYPKLELGAKLTYKIICRAIKAGSAKNTARIKFDQFDREIIDEEGTSVYE